MPQASKSKEACFQHACNIQVCLRKKNFVIERCREEILDLQKCCEDYAKESNKESKHCAALSGIIAEISKK